MHILIFYLLRMGRHRKTPLIRSGGFSNPTDLSLIELRAISISSTNDIPNFLRVVNWNRGAYGVISLNLSPDNLRVSSGSFNLVGSLFASKIFNAANFWPTLTPISLSINLPDLSLFKFPDGKLVSSYLSSSLISHSFTQNGAVLSPDSYPNHGISAFCLRAFVYPSTDAFVKIILTLIPSEEARLLEQFPFHDDPRFPGIKLCSYELPLGPPHSAPPINRLWGSPIFPVIIPGSPWLEDSTPIPGSALRHALDSILTTAVLPDAKQSFTTYGQRCDTLLTLGHSNLKSNLPPIAWPTAEPLPLSSATTQGWFVLFIQPSFLTLIYFFLI